MRGRVWLVGGGVLLGALVIYLGVSSTAPEGPTDSAQRSLPVPEHITYRAWNQETWQLAAERSSLVFLFVADSLSRRSGRVDSVLSATGELRAAIARRFVPLKLDRRLRPDLAERYAEGAAPFLSVLLPTGEAILRLEGEPESWAEQLVEADRYWRDHREELTDKALDFWNEVESDSLAATTAAPNDSHIAIVRASIEQYLKEGYLESGSTKFWWRPDVYRFLAAYHRPDSATPHDTFLLVAAELVPRQWEYTHELQDRITPAGIAREAFVLWHTHISSSKRKERASYAYRWLRQLSVPTTAEEEALSLALAQLLDSVANRMYPGSWLGLDPASSHALPHMIDQPAPLDGYLMDAIAWLECFLLTDYFHVSHAERLADSMWLNLWDPERHAFRDKPAGATPVREIDVYPRAQLGRIAYLFDLLAVRTKDVRWRHRADSCLAGFAPYVTEAGAAASYYGWALLMRRQPDGNSGFPSTRWRSTD